MNIEQLIANGESETVEFKTTLQWDVHQGKKNEALRHNVLKTIAAFLNTRGGTLLIGVHDDGAIYGLEADLKLVRGSLDRFEQLLANLFKEHIGTQYTTLIRSETVEIEGKQVYAVQVESSPEPVFLESKGGREFYVRSGTTTQPLDPKETHKYIQFHWSGAGTRPDQVKYSAGGAVMRAFHTIAIPHDDILQGRLELNVFAADLWEVYHGRGPEEYRDPDLFFQKTYLTAGLRNLIEVVEKRLQGQGGDPVIQMQTPFGGGKTHSLIALYHKAREWEANTVVISGTPLTGKETLWGLMAEQLTGSRAGFEDPIAPGRDAIRQLLAAHQPVLVLMDEVLEYVTKAAGVDVGQSTLAAQTLAFMQELTEAVATLGQAALVVTLPSSMLERYDEQATRLFEQLKKISGRVEKIFTPVQDEEVGAIIRRRLFSSVDEKAAAQIINSFVDQAEQEALLPRGEATATYRERFRQTYPFLPEVIDVLYHRWGSFPTFQRTRGTLRLLALVVSVLKTSAQPYISLADFNLANDEIRRELLKHIDNQYDSVLAADITSLEAGARKANLEIGKAYQGLGLGERIATTIFMYSHLGGGGEAGATVGEVKRQNLVSNVPASVVAEVLQKLSGRLLFYLHEQGGRYYFSTTANLNRALTVREESVSGDELRQAEKDILRRSIGGRSLRTFLWPEQSADIPDDDAPKLVILPETNEAQMTSFLAEKGQTPRVHRNTLFFLTPQESMRSPFEKLLRRHLALSALLDSKTLALTPDQRKELERSARQTAQDLQEQVGHLYRLLYLPDRQGVRAVDMGIPTYGATQHLNEMAYERLRSENRLVEKLAPLVIKERYLKNRDYVETRQLAESGSRTPGDVLAVNRQVWEKSIAEGVRQGLFGLGEVDAAGQPKCLYFKEEPSVGLQGGEVLIRAEICQQQRAASSAGTVYPPVGAGAGQTQVAEPGAPAVVVSPSPGASPVSPPPVQPGRTSLQLKFSLPRGQVSSLMGLLNLLQARFARMEISLTLSEGQISEQEIEDKVRETFRQIGTEVEIE